MSIKLVSIALEKTFARIARGQPSAATLKLVAISLLDHASDEGLSIHPSIAKTAARTDLTRRSVSNALAFFRQHGFFAPTGVVGRKRQVIDYQADVDRLLALPDAIVKTASESPTSERVSPVNVVHGYVGTTFTGTSAGDSQGIVNEIRQEESLGDTRSRASQKRATKDSTKTPKKPGRVFTPEQLEKIDALDVAIRKATLIVGAESLTRKIAITLLDGGYDARDVLGLYVGERSAWRRFDFRGKKGERPTATVIQFTIGSLSERAAQILIDGDPESDTRQAKILARAREKAREISERTAANA